MSGSVEIKLPNMDFEGMARALIAEKLTESLIGSDAAIRHLVVATMTRKVNGSGQVSQYSYENKFAFADWVASDLLQKVVKDVLKTKVDEMRPTLEKEVHAALMKSAKSIAKTLVASYTAQVQNIYKVNVNLELSGQD